MYNYAGVAVGTEFCHVGSPPMTDPTLWTFVLAKQTDTQEQSDVTPRSGAGTKKESIIITTVCTLLAFILGTICGLTAYHGVSALLKRKADHEQQSTASLNTDKSGKRVHYKSNATNREPSAVYDEVTPHYSKPGMPSMQMELNENVAYGQF